MIVDHAIFSNDGPNLKNLNLQINLSVIPKIYKLKNKKNICKWKSNIFPNLELKFQIKEMLNKIAGTNPIKVLIKAVKTNEIIISLIFIGAINRFVKFLLQISSKNNILKLILDLNKKS